MAGLLSIERPIALLLVNVKRALGERGTISLAVQAKVMHESDRRSPGGD
jgi:hypothetical protein